MRDRGAQSKRDERREKGNERSVPWCQSATIHFHQYDTSMKMNQARPREQSSSSPVFQLKSQVSSLMSHFLSFSPRTLSPRTLHPLTSHLSPNLEPGYDDLISRDPIHVAVHRTSQTSQHAPDAGVVDEVREKYS